MIDRCTGKKKPKVQQPLLNDHLIAETIGSARTRSKYGNMDQDKAIVQRSCIIETKTGQQIRRNQIIWTIAVGAESIIAIERQRIAEMQDLK